jgi:hypothetical protein
MKKTILLSTIFSFLAFSANAQTSLLQTGNRTAGRIPMYATTGGPNNPPMLDSGPAGGGNVGTGINELGMTIRGTGTPPFANAGTGQLLTNFCDYDAPITNATGYHFFCLSPNAQGGGLLAYGNGGSAAPLPFKFYVNGSYYSFPFTIGGIVGPATSVVNDVACWNNTTGTLLKDCGTLNTNLTVGTTPISSGTSGRVLYDNASVLGEMITGTTGNSVLLQTTSGGTISPTVLPNPSATTLGGVRSIVSTTHQWVNTISTSGIPSTTQPNFSDLAGSLSPSQLGNIAAKTVLGNNTTGPAAPAAIKQNVQWYNIQNYGAVGNGSADDLAAINAAIAAAGSNAMIYFPGTPNCYGISAGINITGYNITLVGDGMQASQICALNTFTAGDMVTFSHTQFGGAQNIGIYSVPTRTAGSGVGAILREHGDFGLIFDKISVAGGLYADYIDGGTIADRHTNNNYSNNGTPVSTTGTAAIMITGTSFASDVPQDIFFHIGEVGNYLTDMEVDNVSGLYVDALSLESNLSNTYGLVFNPTGSQQIYAVHLTNVISETFALHTGYPFLFTGTGQIYNVFMDNCHAATGLAAIYANNAALDGLTITGGNYINSYNAGIVLGAGSRIILQGVHVYASSLQGSGLYPGIVINGANNSSVVNSSSSGANQSYPIQVLAGNANLIAGNQFAGNVSNTIPDAGTNTYIFCNQPNGCSGGGGGGTVFPDNTWLTSNLGYDMIKVNSTGVALSYAGATNFVNGSFLPTLTNTVDLGGASNIWNNFWTKNATFSGAITTPITGSTQCLQVNSSGIVAGSGGACGGAGAVSSVTGSGSGISVSPTTGAVIVSNTGVTSNSAGYGISISGGTGPSTISASTTIPKINDPGFSQPIIKVGSVVCSTTPASYTFAAAFPNGIDFFNISTNSTTPVYASFSGTSVTGFTVVTNSNPTSGFCGWMAVGH